MNYYCKYCGTKASSIASLTGSPCSRHPNGANKGKHALYEGDEKPRYECKYCGTGASSISSLTGSPCSRHPLGANKGKHEPAM
jgi:predicted nucleic acid-binding Zn ribbon protein